VDWPTVDDAVAWMKNQAVGGLQSTDRTVLERIVDNAVETVQSRLDPARLVSDAPCPGPVHEAVIRTAVQRYFERAPRPAQLDAETVPVGRVDGPVPALLAPYLMALVG
jgi:hypothetical protein